MGKTQAKNSKTLPFSLVGILLYNILKNCLKSNLINSYKRFITSNLFDSCLDKVNIIESTPSFLSHSQFIVPTLIYILFNNLSACNGISLSLLHIAVPIVPYPIFNPSLDDLINLIITSELESKSSNQFLTILKLPLIPLLHMIDKYFLLLDNKATDCLGFISKFLLKEIIKNSKADMQSSYDLFSSKLLIFKV